MPLIIGVDSSTQSVKAELRDVDTGEVVASARRPHTSTTPPCSEQDPGEWWSAMAAAVAEVASGHRHDVAAISVAGQQHGMVVVDASGAVIRPAKLWNDTQSSPQSMQLVQRFGAQQWAQACGSVPVPALTITKLAWLKHNEPQSFARMAKVLLPHDWLTGRLVGRAVTDRGDASGTGYWSPAEGRWRTDLLAMVDDGSDWGAMLPTVLSPFEAAGTILTDMVQELGLGTAEVIVAPGTGDNMAAALGLGLGPGDVAISLGTSGTVYSVSDTPTADGSGAVAGFADASGHYLPLVCTLNAMKVTDAVARLLGVDHHEFTRLALDAPSGAGGLVLLPYLDGERTPNRPDATGILAGIRSDVTRAHLARAAVEGVVCGLLDGLDALTTAGVRTDGRLFLIGGGSRSLAFQSVVAALSGRPVIVPAADEFVTAGACLQAALTLSASASQSGLHPTSAVAQTASDWDLGTGTTIEAAAGVDIQAVRDAYAQVRA